MRGKSGARCAALEKRRSRGKIWPRSRGSSRKLVAVAQAALGLRQGWHALQAVLRAGGGVPG